MCGIWFSIGFEPPHAVIDVVAYRGPDAEGWQELPSSGGPVTLGHRRLAIIDLSDQAEQPMSLGDGRYWIVFNGEIYNYKELRSELESLGHRFRTQGDTEVLLTAYTAWGQDCLYRLNGMFAFAIWDAEKQTLFAARDRFGIKPLYFYSHGGRLCLASEIKQILQLAFVGRRLHQGAAGDFLALGGLTDHRRETLFDGIHRVMGGESLTVTAADGMRVRRWYRPQPADGIPESENGQIDAFADLLRDSVRLRLRSDVPVGSCLSGGLDSSSIVCLMDEFMKGDNKCLHTFSGCFENPEIDERPYMRAVVDKTGALATEIYPQAQEFEAEIDGIVGLMDEPFENPSIYLQHRVFRAVAGSKVKVILDGQGADEHLAGYKNMWRSVVMDHLRHGRVSQLTTELAADRRSQGTALTEQVRTLLGGVRQILGGRAGVTLAAAPAFLKAAFLEATAASTFAEPEPTTLPSLIRYRLMTAKLPALLRYEDRNSMAHGIEARVPFLDHRLVEFSLALKTSMKVRQGVTKHVLREAMKSRLPESVYRRRDKLGYATPDHIWLSDSLRQTVRDVVMDLPRRLPQVFDGKRLEQFVVNQVAEPKFRSGIWRYYFFSRWLEHFGVQ